MPQIIIKKIELNSSTNFYMVPKAGLEPARNLTSAGF